MCSVSPCFGSGCSEQLLFSLSLSFSAVYSIHCPFTTSFHSPFTLSSKHFLPTSSHFTWKNASPTLCLPQQFGLKAETNPALFSVCSPRGMAVSPLWPSGASSIHPSKRTCNALGNPTLGRAPEHMFQYKSHGN